METVIHFHGELVIVEGLVGERTGVELTEAKDIKLADSEVTGNDHMLEFVDGLTVWRDEDADKFFVRSEKPTKIYCKIKDRHDDLLLKEGVDYTIFPAREYDHLSEAVRNVRD